MAEQRRRGFKEQVTAPLVIAAVLAVVAFCGTFITATGGTENEPQFVLAATVAGGVFVVTVVVCATLILVEKPNDPELGHGTGVHRSSAALYAEVKARRLAAENSEQSPDTGDDGTAGAGHGETD